MKYSFALAAIVAIVQAQEYVDFCDIVPDDPSCQPPKPPTPEPTYVEKFFELNEAGQFQLVLPEGSPAISFTDADDAAIKAWFDGKMADATALDMEFLEAWKSYESAVQQPYNDFLTQVEELTVRGIEMDSKNKQEIFTWMTSNTFVDGEALIDKYPQIEEVIAGIEAQATQMSESFSLDRLRATPNALYYKHHSLQSESPEGYFFINDWGECVYKYADGSERGAEMWECEQGSWEEPSHPVKDAFQEDMEQAAENLMSYGFDPEVVNRWFEDKTRSFEDLQHQQDIESANQAQTAVREAADYMKGIADKWIADMPRQHDEWMAEQGDMFQGVVDNMKTKLDEQAAHDIAAIDSWVNDTYSQIVSMTQEEVDVNPFDEEPVMEPAIMLAKKSTNKREHYAYGFAAASVGFAAMGAYIYLTKKQQKVSTEKKQQLLDADFEFQLV